MDTVDTQQQATSPDTSSLPSRLRDHLPVLDGIRAIAVLLVLWAHLPLQSLPDWINTCRYVIQPGYFGVDIFFVLSGFLITRILLVEKERKRPLRQFLIRRFLRIFPIYYLTILTLLWIAPGFYLVWCVAYLSNFSFAFDPVQNPMRHTWSLAVEEHGYIVWPLIVYGLSVARSRFLATWILIPGAILCAVVTLAMNNEWFLGHGGDLVYRGSMYRAASLLLGAVFAYHESWLRADSRHLWRVILLLLIPALIIIPAGKGVGPSWLPLTKMLGFGLLSGVVVLGGIVLHVKRSVWIKALVRQELRFIGRISYGLYLYHFPIYYALGFREAVPVLRNGVNELATPAQAHTLILGVVLTFTLATASFYLIERPLLKIKDRFH